MKKSYQHLKAGSRKSPLALIQARFILNKFKEHFPFFTWELSEMDTPGDRDRKTDLKISPGDFFTKDLDDALLSGEIDFAVHSAKDLPEESPQGIEWFWLPWKECREDVIVCPVGVSELPEKGIVGVSSERRESYCSRFFPEMEQKPLRGNIEQRLEQLDRGDFDMIITAKAALDRLGLSDRITHTIPLSDLDTPRGQGTLALTFRTGDPVFQEIRSLFVKNVVFAGAGAGNRENATLRCLNALKNCDICLYDSLIDPALLKDVGGECVYTGKRAGKHSFDQETITKMIADYASMGMKVVRLKGGDPGVFGRLLEETDYLTDKNIPFLVIPGISSLAAATTETGMLLTRRGISRGFTVLTSRERKGGMGDTGPETRKNFPLAWFMSLKTADHISQQLLSEGRSEEEPAAVVFNAGSPDRRVIQTTLKELPTVVSEDRTGDPGIILVGSAASSVFKDLGPFQGEKILLTCSDNLMEEGLLAAEESGGRGIPFSLIELTPSSEFPQWQGYDWIVLTSPSAVRFFIQGLKKEKADFRKLPRFMVPGEATGRVLKEHSLYPEICPQKNFSGEELKSLAEPLLKKSDRVLRLRSDRASSLLTDFLKEKTACVEDRILYSNSVRKREVLPDFDSVFFASSSAVNSFNSQWGLKPLEGKAVVVIGLPTARALKELGFNNYILSPRATVRDSLEALALKRVQDRLRTLAE